MSTTLLDLSQRAELKTYALVIADVQALTTKMRMPTMITGAFARDLHILYAHGISTGRKTEDVDVGLAVADWLSFNELKHALVETTRFTEVPKNPQRVRHRESGLPVDLVPFGDVESKTRCIDWPGADLRMDVFGFKEALAQAVFVQFPQGVRASVASLPALALLKFVAWDDRHYREPRKDAHDLMIIITSYLDVGNADRLWSEHPDWCEAEGFDYVCAGAQLLGFDIARLLNGPDRERFGQFLRNVSDENLGSSLAQEMSTRGQEKVYRLLTALLEGFLG